MIAETLTWSQLEKAAHIGCARYIKALRQGRKEIYGTPPDPWGVHIEGAAAEMVVAKALNLFWPACTDPDWDGDVGPFHVRSTDREHGCLPLHKRDRDDGRFILAVGTGATRRLAGWLVARDGKLDVYWRTDLPRAPCYMVPQSDLNSMDKWYA